jgi:Kdo2-lipid A phosphotransferase
MTFLQNTRFLWLCSLTMIAGLFVWFAPITHPFCVWLDTRTFEFLNAHLLQTPEWQAFFGLLNHKNENRYNLLFAAAFNLWAILQTKEPELRRKRIRLSLYFWLCFQLGYMLVNLIFVKWLALARLSPSLVLEPTVRLSEVLGDPNIKDANHHSFPGGHAFSLIYWASFTFLCAPKRIAVLGFIIAVLLCIPRLVVGAHWLSDVLFSSIMALVWLNLTLQTPVYRKLNAY